MFGKKNSNRDKKSLSVEQMEDRKMFDASGMMFTPVINQIDDVDLSNSQTPNQVSQVVSQQPLEVDRSFFFQVWQDNGQLKIKTTRPAEVEVNGVSPSTVQVEIRDRETGDLVQQRTFSRLVSIHIEGSNGDDRIENNSSLPATIEAKYGNDYVRGGSENDTIYGGGGADRLEGGDGHDTLIGGSEADTLFGGEGNDTLRGGQGNDWLYGGNGDDRIFGDDGNDVLRGNDGANTLDGGNGNDSLTGGRHNDMLIGGHGNDSLTGGAGRDTLRGDAGNDRLYGGTDNDVLMGGSGSDRLDGYHGNDRLLGGSGYDYLYGGDGADGLFGGLNESHRDNTMVGGNDADRYLYHGPDSDSPFENNRTKDVAVKFWDNSSSWTEKEIQVVDEAFEELQDRVGGHTWILKDSFSDEELIFRKTTRLPNSWSGRNQWWWWFGYHRRIDLVNWNEADAAANESMKQVVIHEIAHNWDATDGEPNRFWGDFNRLHEQSDSSRDYARTYGETNSLEDWATTWEVAFSSTPSGKSSRFNEKLDLVNQFLDQDRTWRPGWNLADIYEA